MENIICHHTVVLAFVMITISFICVTTEKIKIEIGVILDMETSIGKMSSTCISMALRDFYQQHVNYTTEIQLHFRDAKQDNVQAASAAIDLLKNDQVMAILGPMRSAQADFVINIGNKSNVPIISPATSPYLSTDDNVYFIRTAPDSSLQLEPIAELINHFKWKEIVFIYEAGEYGRGLVPYLSEAMMNIDTKVMSRNAISPSASDDSILEKLYKLKTMQTRVFVVHVLPDLAVRFFKKANEAGMMEEGYVWIITEVLTSRLHSFDHTVIDSMQGVLGVKSYIPRSNELVKFEKQWKRQFMKQYPEDDVTELDMFGIWTYDTFFVLAMALERIGLSEMNTSFKRQRNSTTDLGATGISEMGSRILPWIRNSCFKGLSGDFRIVNGQLQWSVHQIVNVIGTKENGIGFWTSKNGISKKLNEQTNNLRAVIWPGDSHVIPKGWEIPTSNVNTLRVGVPVQRGFGVFIDANTNPQTNQVIITGFVVDVFNAVIDALPYAVKHEFVTGTYIGLMYGLSDGTYDAVAGDITIRANRADIVDFTLPYTESGVSMIVAIKDERKSAWIFMRPLEKELWITIGAFFIYTGLVVWILEHQVNKEFRGPPHKQVGMIFWFSFSTLVFAHREKVMSNLSRFVVVVWVFVVLVLTSSYTASLTSMLTVQQLRPTYTDIHEIMRNGESVGYQDGSFVLEILKDMGFDDSKVKNYSTFEQYDEALQKGSKNGGVSAIMDELPYNRVFLAKYCSNYTMTGPIYKSAGFGFAFPKGSPLVHDVSTAVLKVTENQMTNLSRKWFGDSASCDQQNDPTVTSDKLTLDSFKGLFLIAGLSSTSALMFFFLNFLYQNRRMLSSQDSVSQKLVAIAKTFDLFKDDESKRATAEVAAVDESVIADSINNSPANNIFHQDEGFLTNEPGTPVRDSIELIETTAQQRTPVRLTIQVLETSVESRV
ncbi:glutamate receptor 2.7-like [Rutidosis leptorrhynchoides]|uniref:glutamate receptor 2.7-like n=1 Tax=Rutidosis leptorrhynchoides TaxID=125765 RepID=UPI003A991D80